jgi:hypothetical protein
MAVELPQPFDSTDYDSPTLGNVLETLPGQFDFSNITLTPTTVANAVIGVAYTQQITISGGLAPYGNLFVSAGNLPANLSLSSTTNDLVNNIANANITGIPTNYGNITFTIQGNDVIANISFPTQQTYNLLVNYPTITISPGSLTNAVVGQSYSQAFTASGGTGPYTYSNVGNLPPSLSLSGSGSLTGNITTTTTPQSLTIQATDSYGSTGNATYSLTITRPTINIAPSTLSNATTGASYSANITAAGGTAPYSYAVTGNTLPNNLSLNANTGVLSGVVIADGIGNFSITATDFYSTTATNNYSLTTVDPTILISPPTISNGVVGTAYTQIFTSSGGTGPYTYSVTGGTLPANLVLATSGNLSGTPSTAATSNFTITSTDTFSTTGSFTYSDVVMTSPTISLSPTTFANATADSPYSANVFAFGGIAPYTFAVTSGTLPSGLNLSNSGAITGIPTSVSTFNFTITASDLYSSTGNRVYTILVNPPAITISPLAIPQAVANVSYTATFTAAGGTAPYTYASAQLPAGMSLASSTGVLSGTPLVNGYQPFVVVATDDNGYPGSRLYNFVVAPNVPSSAIRVFVGGILQTSGYTVTSKSPATITFDEPPPEGVDVTIAVLQGETWYQPGPYSASDGVPLQETETTAARFLRGL